jgi:hypothetical protein
LTIQHPETTESTLDLLLRALKNYPDEALAPYEEFKVGAKTYYFSPGGSLYRKDPEVERPLSYEQMARQQKRFYEG